MPLGAVTHRGAAPSRTIAPDAATTQPPKDDEDQFSETESARKLKKMRFFSAQCSNVFRHLYVSGDKVAQDRQKLLENNISRILNCAGTVLPCHHKADPTLQYFTLPLLDSQEEQIARYFYPVISMMEEAEAQGQNILVHCHQGVSRSCTLSLCYIMFSANLTYDQAFHSLREARGIGQPNIGFMCQLIDWDKRRRTALSGGSIEPAVYFGFPSDADAYDSFPGAMWLVKPGHATLQARRLQAADSCVVLHTVGEVQLWVGPKCSDAISDGARRHCEYLTKYEGAPKHQEVQELYAESFTESLRELGFEVESK